MISLIIENIQTTEAWREKGIHKIGQVVLTERALEEGTIFKEEDLFERMVDPETLNSNAILCKDFVIGKKAHYSISANQQLTAEDIGISAQELENEEVKKLDKAKPDPLLGICGHSKMTKIPLVKTLFVVKTVRPLEEGYIVKACDLKLERADTDFDTSEAIRDIRLVVGRKIKYSTIKDQALISNDFQQGGDEAVKAVVALRDINAQEEFKEKDVDLKSFNSGEYPINALLDKSFVVSNKATQNIKTGQIIRIVDVSKGK